jgi:hypothetical protein
MKVRCLLIASLFMTGCSTSSTSPDKIEAASTVAAETVGSPSDYVSTVARWTQFEQGYDKFAQSFKVAGTVLSRELVDAQVRLDGENFNWSADQKEQNRQKALYDLQTQTTVLVSLYTAKDEDNNLDKSNSVWNLFLDVNGKRLVPQSVKRIFENRASLLQKYPHLEIWNKNYYVKFAVPTDDATSSHAAFTIAGPLGSAHMKF